eukprot:6286722-Prymnesium_polylepis.1
MPRCSLRTLAAWVRAPAGSGRAGATPARSRPPCQRWETSRVACRLSCTCSPARTTTSGAPGLQTDWRGTPTPGSPHWSASGGVRGWQHSWRSIVLRRRRRSPRASPSHGSAKVAPARLEAARTHHTATRKPTWPSLEV